MRRASGHLLLLCLFLNFSSYASEKPASIWAKKEIIEPKTKNCMREYQKTASQICHDIQKMGISKALKMRVMKKIRDQNKRKLFWTAEQINEAADFLKNYEQTSSLFSSSQRLWCALSQEPRLNKGNQPSTKERCSFYPALALKTDSKELEELNRLLDRFSLLGLNQQLQSSADALKKVELLKQKIGTYSASDVDLLISDMAQLKLAADAGYTKDRLRLKVKLKECYRIEKIAPEAFTSPRPAAPKGYTCASFEASKE